MFRRSFIRRKFYTIDHEEPQEDKADFTVSVVIPIYKEELYIEKCLLSVFAQSYDTLLMEIILVDGGFSDKTVDMTEKFKLTHTNIKLLLNPKTV